MIQIITGDKGKGKTKVLIEKVNNDVKVVSGSVIFIDNNNKHMYELSNRVRLINCTNFHIKSAEMFEGFLLGIISQDNDIEKMYIDNFTSVAFLKSDITDSALTVMNEISEKFNIDIILCFETDGSDIPEQFKANIIAAL